MLLDFSQESNAILVSEEKIHIKAMKKVIFKGDYFMPFGVIIK